MAKKTNKVEKVEEVKKKSYGNNKELAIIIGGMVIIIGLVVGFYLYFSLPTTFVYEGLKFTEQPMGKITFYLYNYRFNDAKGHNYVYSLYVRNDPRKSNVTLEGAIVYPKQGSRVYVGINETSLAKCSDSTLAIGALSSFLTDNLYSAKGGTIDPQKALEFNKTYVSCADRPGSMNIILNEGNETKIVVNGSCHNIIYSDCRVLDAVEKFEVESIVAAKKGTAQ